MQQCRSAKVTDKDMGDPVKSKAEFDMFEELEVSIETKENEMDELMEKIAQMQRDAAAVMADRQEEKDKAMVEDEDRPGEAQRGGERGGQAI